MLIDDVTIKIKSGDGGRGAVAFNKNMMSLGPTGGSGGRGGNVYALGVADINALHQFRYRKELRAENGHEGRGQFRDGENGEDLILKLPVGTVIHTRAARETGEISTVGEKILLAPGGQGGRGNFHFRSSKNTSPRQFQSGKPGETFELRLELKLIADVGLIGLPNAGKSSFLNQFSNAQSKVANYPFTTLEPNLGAYYELILADIPGLIAGSSRGRGLGIKFLRHIERTKILFHFISAESENVKKDYETIRRELGNYRKGLLKKTECLFLTKSDLLPAPQIKNKLEILKKINSHVLVISLYDSESLEAVKGLLNKIKEAKVTGADPNDTPKSG